MGPAFTRKYATLLVTGTTAIRITMIKRGVVDFAVGADWTPAAGDVKIAVDGAAPTNVTNLPTAVASGNAAYWEFVITAAELTGKTMVVTIADSATKAVEDNAFIIETCGHTSAMWAFDFTDGVRAGLTSLPNAVAGAVNGLPLGDASGRVDLGKWVGTAPNALVAGKVDSTESVRTGTAQAGAAGTITLDSGASATDNFYRGQRITVASGTGAGQTRLITAYVGSTKVATMLPVWATNPDNTSVFIVDEWAEVDIAAVALTTQTARDLGATLGVAGAGLTALGDTRIANLDAAVSSRTKPADTQARVTLVDTVTAVTGLTASNLDATVSSRSTYAGGDTAGTSTLLARIAAVITITNNKVDVNDKTGFSLSAVGVQAIWDVLSSALTTANSIGKRIVDYLTGDAFARLGAPANASHAADVAAVKVDTAAVKVQTDKLAFTVSNQVDVNVLDWKSATAPAMTGDAFARLGAPALASIAADIASRLATSGYTVPDNTTIASIYSMVDTEIATILTRIGIPSSDVATLLAAIGAKTTNLPSDPADASDIAGAFSTVVAAIGALNNVSAAQVLAQVNTALTTAVADSIPADGSRPSPSQALYMIVQYLMERVVTGVTVTVNKPDGTTALLTQTLNDSSNPTSVTRAT